MHPSKPLTYQSYLNKAMYKPVRVTQGRIFLFQKRRKLSEWGYFSGEALSQLTVTLCFLETLPNQSMEEIRRLCLPLVCAHMNFEEQ